MLATKAPTDQRAGVRPISFILNDVGVFRDPVTLSIRPEDLTRPEPSRASVHQTLGRGTQGWVDNFGAGLPSVTISGHTGWRTAAGSGMDGAASFIALNKLVMVDYHAAKQSAIDRGIAPDQVSLIFVDLLDGFTWSVVPMQFVLRRSKSRPLLFQYNITMQAISTEVGSMPVDQQPAANNPGLALSRLNRSIAGLSAATPALPSSIRQALSGSGLGALTGDFAQNFGRYIESTTAVLNQVSAATAASPTLTGGDADALVATARNVVRAGQNVIRLVNSTPNIPLAAQSTLSAVTSSLNESSCIMAGGLHPKNHYDDFSGLFGASNCSSTVGGHPESAYAGQNVFSLLASGAQVSIASGAQASIAALRQMDSILAPMSYAEITRNLIGAMAGMPR